jgi:hypothetical protein
MAAMPGPAYAVSNLPRRLTIRHRSNMADNFMTRGHGTAMKRASSSAANLQPQKHKPFLSCHTDDKIEHLQLKNKKPSSNQLSLLIQ